MCVCTCVCVCVVCSFIQVPGRVYNISADTEQEQSTWMTSINTTLAVIKSLPVSVHSIGCNVAQYYCVTVV